MNEWLQLIVALSVAGSTVVLCMLFLRLISVGSFTAKWQYRMGKAAIMLYLFPIAIVLQKLPSQVSESRLEWGHTDFSPIAPIAWGSTGSVQPLSVTLALVLFSLWLLGVLAVVLWQGYSYVQFRKWLHKGTFPVLEQDELVSLLEKCKQELGLRSKVNVAYHGDIQSPALVGLLKPTILLPAGENSLDMEMVFRHELIHLKRKDLWVKMAAMAVSVVHWFNPFAHLLRRDIHMWSELSCDEEAVKEMSYTDRKKYGQTILNVVERSSEMPLPFGASLSGSVKLLKRRLVMVMNMKKLKKKAVIVSTAVVIVAGALGTTTAVWAAKHTPPVVSDVNGDYIITANIMDQSEPIQLENGEFVRHLNVDELKSLSRVNTFETTLIAVNPSDEKRFSPEEWQNILAQIDRGEVFWEDSPEFKEYKAKVERGEMTWNEVRTAHKKE
ncbi:MAG: M56 family metallopeptidase [Paenibacillus dendritiformis]|uniref:M56 family metallopeptidase n=1 Tax=uncultured Paenibacillus sp. TaxID=227322 RepID=UPI0025F60A7F|nr:M56 family metallopeptidase [uncultured Paenibacillus sp.]MDU5145419.1 M56 family metallopeptidase [Paenibacillus dendritiformis]